MLNQLKASLYIWGMDCKRFLFHELPLYWKACPIRYFFRHRPTLTAVLLGFAFYAAFPFLCFGLICLIGSVPTDYDLQQPAEQVERIEIIHVHPDSNSLDFVQENMEWICTVDPQDHTGFLTQLEQVPIYHPYGPPSTFLDGAAVRITYRDGYQEILSEYGRAYTSADDGDDLNYYSYHPGEEFLTLLIQYGYICPESQATSKNSFLMIWARVALRAAN